MFEERLRKNNDNHHDKFLDFCQPRWPLVRTDQFDGEHGFIRFNILVFLYQPHSHRPRRFRLWRHPGKRIALGSKPPLLTRIVRTGLETRLFLNVIHLDNIRKGGVHVPNTYPSNTSPCLHWMAHAPILNTVDHWRIKLPACCRMRARIQIHQSLIATDIQGPTSS